MTKSKESLWKMNINLDCVPVDLGNRLLLSVLVTVPGRSYTSLILLNHTKTLL